MNAGVVLASEEAGYFKVSIPRKPYKRFKCLDPSFDPDVLDAIEEWLEDEGEYWRSAASGDENGAPGAFLDELVRMSAGGRFQLGDFRTIEMPTGDDPAALDEVLLDLVDRDVHWSRGLKQRPQRPTFNTEFGQLLRDARLFKPSSTSSPVQKNLRIEQLDLSFDYGYQNGALNVIETVDIRDLHSEDRVVDQVAPSLLKLQRAKTFRDEVVGGIRPVAVVSGKRHGRRDLSPTVMELIRVADRVYFLGETQERRELVARIRKDLGSRI